MTASVRVDSSLTALTQPLPPELTVHIPSRGCSARSGASLDSG